MSEKITAWVTRYALTRGIEVVEGEVDHDISASMLCYGRGCYAHGNDWHRTREAAVARAEAMRQKKIASLRKSITKLEAMKIEAPNERYASKAPDNTAEGDKRDKSNEKGTRT